MIIVNDKHNMRENLYIVITVLQWLWLPDTTVAKVKILKPKDCPMLTRGELTAKIINNWFDSGKCYVKYSNKVTADTIVSYIANTMLEPHLAQWY